VEPALVEKMAFPLPDEPSIAVLPFTNMSGDPEQEYLSDLFTEQIISGLSMIPRLFVISRNTTSTYKGKAVKVQQVAEELGVRYLLEGSVQKSEEKVRITAQLIDAIKGHYLWSDRYDRNLKDIFALQDEITIKIMSAIQVKLMKGERARITARGTNNFEAYIKVMQARHYVNRRNKEGNIQARKLAEEAVALDPEYPSAYALLGQTHVWDVLLGLSKSPRKSLQESVKLRQKALAIDESHLSASTGLSYAYAMQRQHDKSLAQAERAVALNPGMGLPNAMLGTALFRVGRYEEAIQSLEKAIRLDPKGPSWSFIYLGEAYCFAGRYQEAIAVLKRAIGRAPDSWIIRAALTAIYSMAGREEEAGAQAAEILRLHPKFSLEHYGKVIPWRKTELEPWLEALRKAGLPDKPPLPLPDKPSIAVLPFTNRSDDPKQEYFVDGMTDDLITDLSKISGLFVIARNSVFPYKGKDVDVKRISRELGVKHVLEGSVRKVGKQVRINARLIDASTGGPLWAERYDGKMDDVLALQDKITHKIVTALAVKLTGIEKEQITRKETYNIAAYDAFLKGWGHYLRHTPEDYAKALSQFEKAIELDPKYGRAYASLALIYARTSKLGKQWRLALYLTNTLVADRRAKKYLELAMKKPTSTAYRVASFIHIYERRFEEAIAAAERALSFDPNDSGCHENMAFVLIMAGRPQEAFDSIEKAMRLDPHNLANPLYYAGLAYFSLKEFKEAADSLQRALTYSPRHSTYLFALTAVYGHLGLKKEANATLERFLITEYRTADYYSEWERFAEARLDKDLFYTH
jgi:TolB-like protein/Flp pilus assembly protein TadD